MVVIIVSGLKEQSQYQHTHKPSSRQFFENDIANMTLSAYATWVCIPGLAVRTIHDGRTVGATPAVPSRAFQKERMSGPPRALLYCRTRFSTSVPVSIPISILL